MSPRQRAVLAALADDRDGYYPYLRTVAEEIGVPHRDVRNAARALARHGYAKIEHLFNDTDGLTAGSTYVRTAAGRVVLAADEGAS